MIAFSWRYTIPYLWALRFGTQNRRYELPTVRCGFPRFNVVQNLQNSVVRATLSRRQHGFESHWGHCCANELADLVLTSAFRQLRELLHVPGAQKS